MCTSRRWTRVAMLLFVLAPASISRTLPSLAYDGAPSAFRRDDASAIGRARQHYDRAQYRRYRGNPGAQFELRQKRQNLCRNVPEMC